jgi:hypothetical protein
MATPEDKVYLVKCCGGQWAERPFASWLIRALGGASLDPKWCEVRRTLCRRKRP